MPLRKDIKRGFITKLTVWGVSPSIAVLSEETATAAETWHHHYDNNDYNGSDQHTDNDANGIAEKSEKSNKHKIKYWMKEQIKVTFQYVPGILLEVAVLRLTLGKLEK